jgi:hypothetical protein
MGGFAASAGIDSGSGEGVRNSSAGGFGGGNFPVRERVSRILITGVGGRGEDLVLVLEIVTLLSKVTRMAAALLHVAVLERNLLNAAKETFYRHHPRERRAREGMDCIRKEWISLKNEGKRRRVKKARRELFRGKVGRYLKVGRFGHVIRDFLFLIFFLISFRAE